MDGRVGHEGVCGLVLRSVGMAFALFSKVPMPTLDWDDANMRYMMAAFPVVGALVGIAQVTWWLLAGALGLGSLSAGVGLALVPLALTGGIHLDGLCDVCDALSSHAEPARKREILKDPRVGAFAVMGVMAYLLAQVAAFNELVGLVPRAGILSVPASMWALALVPVASRCLSGVATLAFPKSSERGMLAMFSQSADVRHALLVLGIEFVCCATALVGLGGVLGAAVVICDLACLAAVRCLARREFGGMSGDLAGWFLQMAELAMAWCLVVGLHLSVMGVVA